MVAVMDIGRRTPPKNLLKRRVYALSMSANILER
jgi:hypothetical protein